VRDIAVKHLTIAAGGAAVIIEWYMWWQDQVWDWSAGLVIGLVLMCMVSMILQEMRRPPGSGGY
jgi:hypothetical protein